jgi:hypothetical protein
LISARIASKTRRSRRNSHRRPSIVELEDVSVSFIPNDRMTASAVAFCGDLGGDHRLRLAAKSSGLLAAVVEADLDTDDALHGALLQMGRRAVKAKEAG